MLAEAKRPEAVNAKTLKILQDRLRERLTACKLSGNEASRLAGLGLSFVNDILSGASKNPASSRVAAVAEVLDCDAAYLMGAQDKPRMAGGANVARLPIRRQSEGTAVPMIPLHASNWPDAEGFFAMTKDADETTGLPFADVPGGYAVMVPDEANAPRYRAGEVVFVNPRRPIVPGSFVVVRTKDDKAMIREVVTVGADKIEVQCASEKTKRSFKREDIASIHRITASAEM